MKIVIFGAGQTGLVTAACLADIGHQVVCVDPDKQRIAALSALEAPVSEPGLASLIEVHLLKGQLSFSSDLASAMCETAAVFIAVEDGDSGANEHAGEARVCDAAHDIAQALGTCRVVVVHSATKVGVSDQVEAILKAAYPQADVAVVSNPAFTRSGSAITDFMQADRIIIGTTHAQARKLMGQIYRPLYLENVPLVYTTSRTAEIITHASNAYLAMKTAFVAEMGALCAANGGNLQDVARGVDLDRRIGSTLLNSAADAPKPGYSRELLALLRSGSILDAGGTTGSQAVASSRTS